MKTLSSWGEIIINAFQSIGVSFADFLPRLIGALLVLIIGWIIAWALADLVARIIKIMRIDQAVDKLKITQGFEKVGLRFNVSDLVRWLVKWFLIIVSLIAAADILGWSQITEFLNRVVIYLPNVIIAAFILLVGIVLADFVREIVLKTVKAAKLSSAHFLAGISKWAVLIFAVMAALVQLRIAAALIHTLFTGFIAMIAIAGGLAFGLGGRDEAEKFLAKLKKDISIKE